MLRPEEDLPPAPRMAEGRRVYAIGDIHGRADLLAALLGRIEADQRQNARSGVQATYVFLGDYVDRGLESRRCIDLILEGPARASAHFLLGSHDRALLDFLEAPQTGARWIERGGAETLFSYGVRAPDDRTDPAQLRRTSEALSVAMPAAHLDFLRTLKLHVRLGDYLFVHAGLRPGVPLERQTEDDLISIREPFLKSREPWPFVVVHGHSPVPRIHVEAGRIAVDTGAYLTGRLGAVCLEGTAVRQLST